MIPKNDTCYDGQDTLTVIKFSAEGLEGVARVATA